jgi:hypothetical protein
MGTTTIVRAVLDGDVLAGSIMAAAAVECAVALALSEVQEGGLGWLLAIAARDHSIEKRIAFWPVPAASRQSSAKRW